MQRDGPGLVSDALPDGHEDGQASPAAQRARDDAREIESSVQDPARFGVLFDRCLAEIHGYAASRLGRDAADDIAAETFLTAFRKRQGSDPARGVVRGWLYGIATHHMSRCRRREVREFRAMSRTAGPALLQEGHADRVTERVSAGAARDDLARALAELPRGDREVLLLVALAGLPAGRTWSAPGGLFSYQLFRSAQWTNATPPTPGN